MSQAVEGPRIARRWRSRAQQAEPWLPLVLLSATVALFCPLVIVGDGTAYLNFIRRLFGDAPSAVGWYPGLALLDAPFYAIGKLCSALDMPSIGGHPATEALVALAGSVYMLLAVGLVLHMLRVLRLPARGLAALLATVGTPLFYYGIFGTSGTHAAETFLVTAAAAVLLQLSLKPAKTTELTVLAGAILGVGTATRYSIAAMVAGLAAVYVLNRNVRQAVLVCASSAASFGVIWLVTVLTSSPIFAKGGVAFEIGFAPLSPFRMLFTDSRGLFVWTPITVVGLAGFVHLLLRARLREREFLLQLGAMELAYLCFHLFVPEWWAGGSFSSRFLTSIFPLVAIGVGECIAWRPRVAVPVSMLAATWTLYLCLNIVAGIDVIKGDQNPPHLTSATQIAQWPAKQHTGFKEYLYAVWYATHLGH